MPDTSEQRELQQALASLESDRDAVPWTDRRSLAASLGEALPRADWRDIAVRLVYLLANDAKWEVRKEIALLLPLLPDEAFVPLAAKLTQDANGYVRKSAERALDRRRKAVREIGNRRKGLEVVTQFDLLGSTQGRSASDKTRALAVRLYEVAVGATVHDLRGILTSARSHLTRLQSGAANASLDGTALRDGLGKVAHRLAYLEKFVDAMGTYAQAVPPERATAQLADIVRDAHSVAIDAVHSAHLEAAKVEASVTVDDGIMVSVAPHQIVAAIANVLKNAYEAVLLVESNDRPGQVRITAGRVGDGEVQIVIRDNGAGMNPDDLREVRAFIPGRTTKKGYGTGFGLPIAQRYIAAHGGAISVESAVGAGTTVTIVLPTESNHGPDE